MADISRRYVAALTQRPRWVVCATLAVTLLLGYQAIGLRIRSDPDSMFPPDHPYVKIDGKVRRQFGGWHYVLIVVKAKQGSIWSADVLSVVYDITQDVRLLGGVLPNAIFSFASPNVRVIQDDGGVLAPRYLMRTVPEDADGVAALKKTVLANDILRKGLVSHDESATIVSADFDESVTEQEISDALAGIVAARKTDAVELYYTGGPVLLHAYNVYVFQVWQRFLLAFGIIAGILYLSFGTFQGMVIPLASGGLSTCWAVGLMGWTGVKVDQWNTMTPILVMGITAGHSTQLLKRYYEELLATGDNRRAVEQSLLRVAPVMLAAGLTAALGFASLAAFRVPSLRTFGVFTALGILCGLVIELSFMPAVRCLVPPRVHPDPPLDRLFVRVISRVTSSLVRGLHWPYLAVFGLIALWSIVGVFRITADFSFVSYLPQGTDGERNFLAAQKLFPGTLPLVILVEGKEPIAADPRLIRIVSGLQRRLEADSAVVYTTSYVDIMRQAAIAFGGTQPRPGDRDFSRQLAAQLLFLSYSPHYETFLTRDLKRAVIWVFLREVPTETIQGVIDDAKQFVLAQGPQDDWDVQIGGGVAATRVALTESIVQGKIANILIVLSVIFLVSSVIFRSPLGGALVLLPLVFTVLVDLGLLGNLGIPLDPITASVAAMAVGIGADYAIYLIYRMREEVGRGADAAQAIDRAMTSAGRGIFCVAAAIAGGYLTLSVSSFRAFTMVGLLVSSTMIFSSLVSLTLLPLVILRLRPRLVFGDSLGKTPRRRAM